MEEEQRAEQMSIWIIATFLLAVSVKDHLPTINNFFYFSKWYGIPIPWNFIFILFVIVMFLFCFLIDFNAILKEDENP
jgi:hypothetical protein